MELDKEIETPFGVVRFKGTVSDEEFDYIIKSGLLVLMARGQIKAQFIESDEDLLDADGPEDGEPVH